MTVTWMLVECNQQFLNCRGHQFKERLRVQANPEDKDQQRDGGDNLTPVQVAQGMSVLLDLFHDGTFRTEEDLLEHKQDIYGRHDDAQSSQAGKPGRANGLGTKGTQKDGE